MEKQEKREPELSEEQLQEITGGEIDLVQAARHHGFYNSYTALSNKAQSKGNTQAAESYKNLAAGHFQAVVNLMNGKPATE